MDTIKLGFIGLGARGKNLACNILEHLKDVDVVAVCDYSRESMDAQSKGVLLHRGHDVRKYSDYHDLLEDKEVNVVIIAANWESHVPMAIDCMKAGKVAAVEVGGAYSIEDCWTLVKTYEETKTPFVFLENCCYGEKELFVTNMARKGLLGNICYCHGAYGHDLREGLCDSGIDNYRLRNYIMRNCDNYPTHQLGPIAKLLNINRGNRMVSITSQSSKSQGLADFVKGKEKYAYLHDTNFMQGDIVQSLIKCADGSMISLKLDTSLPRAYSRELLVSGTKGFYNEQGNVCLLEGDGFNHDEDISTYYNSAEKYKMQYQSGIWSYLGEEDRNSGHGGMDYLMLRDVFNKILKGEEMPMDVYDAAAWMSISALSEASIAKGGVPIEIPDFTSGNWIMRPKCDVVDLSK